MLILCGPCGSCAHTCITETETCLDPGLSLTLTQLCNNLADCLAVHMAVKVYRYKFRQLWYLGSFSSSACHWSLQLTLCDCRTIPLANSPSHMYKAVCNCMVKRQLECHGKAFWSCLQLYNCLTGYPVDTSDGMHVFDLVHCWHSNICSAASVIFPDVHQYAYWLIIFFQQTRHPTPLC